MNIILIGMPGCGKSTIGVLIAKALGMDFIDTDLIIQKRENNLLWKIIESDGSEAFIQAEESAILSVEAVNTVIATGGSAVFSSKAMKHLKELGTVFYLSLGCDSLTERLSNFKTRGIAFAKDKTIEEIFAQRKPLYELCADRTVICDGLKPAEIVELFKKIITE